MAIYGAGIGGDGLANTILTGDSIRQYVRFRAEHSGTLTTVRFYREAGVPDPGYALGTSGTWKLEVFADDAATHWPTGSALATQSFAADASDLAGFLVTFSSPTTLTAGTLYHIVWTNTDASPSANWWSINHWFYGDVFHGAASGLPDGRRVPRYPDLDWEHGFGSMSTWTTVREGFIPIMDVGYGDGYHQGQSYGEASWHTGEQGEVNGTSKMVRERFTVSGGSRTVTGAGVRLLKIAGSTDPLTVRLETDAGTLIDSFTIAASAIPDGAAPNNGSDYIGVGGAARWVHGNFPASHTLTNGVTYRLRFSTGASATYWMWVNRRLSYGLGGNNYDAATSFEEGLSEKTTNGTDWSMLGSLTNEHDLQFYFDLAGPSTILPTAAALTLTRGTPTVTSGGVYVAVPSSVGLSLSVGTPSVSIGGAAFSIVVGGVDQTAKVLEGSISVKTNTVDFSMYNPATLPAPGDAVTVVNPAWAGTVATVKRQLGQKHGQMFVTVSATNEEDAGASVAPFGLSDTPSPPTTYAYEDLSVETTTNSDGTSDTKGTLTFYQPGLWPAMTFELTSSDLGYTAEDLTVQEVVVTWVKGVPRYAMTFGDPIVTMSVWLNSTAQSAVLPIDETKITDGAVTTPKLYANAVTGDKLAGRIVLGTVIETAESGRRVVLEEPGITLYDDDEAPIVRIPTTTGEPVSVAGDLTANHLVSPTSATFGGIASISGGAELIAEQGVVAPVAPPVLTASTPSSTLTSAPTHPGAGMCYDPAGGAGGATATYWIGADPSGGYSDVAYEYDATTKARLRTITKSGTVQTVTTTLGATSHIADTAAAYSGSNNSQIATPLKMPRAGTIIKAAAWFAGYGGSASCRTAVWNSSGTLLTASGAFFATSRSFINGASDLYNRDVAHVAVAAGATIWVGFLRTSAGDGAQYDRDGGSGKTTKRGDGLDGSMTGIETDTTNKPNAYITYQYTVGSSLEGTMGKIIGVARQGSYIWVLDSNGMLFRYQQSDLTYVDKFNLSAYITGTKANAGLLYDGTNSQLVICTTTGTSATEQLKFVRVSTNGAYIEAVGGTGRSVHGANATVRGGYFDSSGSGFYYVAVVDANFTGIAPWARSGAYTANYEFGQSSEMAGGTCWDGGVWHGWTAARPTTITDYTAWSWTTESPIYWVGYSWYDSAGTTHQTELGPRASITMTRRRQLQVTNNAIPISGVDDPNTVRVYMERGGNEPAAGSYHLQVTDALTTRTLATFAAGGAADPTSNDFPSTTMGTIRSASPNGWSLGGDGTTNLLILGAQYHEGPAVSGLAAGASATLAWGTKLYDTGNTYNATNKNWTVPLGGDGVYLIVANVNVVNQSGGGTRSNLLSGSTTLASDFIAPGVGGTNIRGALVWVGALVEGNVITVTANPVAGASADVALAAITIARLHAVTFKT